MAKLTFKEDLCEACGLRELASPQTILAMTDVISGGAFVKSLKDVALQSRGGSSQCILPLRARETVA